MLSRKYLSPRSKKRDLIALKSVFFSRLRFSDINIWDIKSGIRRGPAKHGDMGANPVRSNHIFYTLQYSLQDCYKKMSKKCNSPEIFSGVFSSVFGRICSNFYIENYVWEPLEIYMTSYTVHTPKLIRFVVLKRVSIRENVTILKDIFHILVFYCKNQFYNELFLNNYVYSEFLKPYIGVFHYLHHLKSLRF